MSESTTNVVTPVCTKIKILTFGYCFKNDFRKGFLSSPEVSDDRLKNINQHENGTRCLNAMESQLLKCLQLVSRSCIPKSLQQLWQSQLNTENTHWNLFPRTTFFCTPLHLKSFLCRFFFLKYVCVFLSCLTFTFSIVVCKTSN